MNIFLTWAAKLAPLFIAIPMAIYGAQHFIYLQFVADFIPAWIPWRVFWAALTGAALIASAVGIAFRLWDRLAATLLAVMIFLWVVLLHTSRIAAQPASHDEWRGIFQALSMSAFVLVLAHSLRRASPLPRHPYDDALNTFLDRAVRLAPYFIAVSMIAFGVEHLLWPDEKAAKIPLWIPGNVPMNYLAGAALLAVGAGLLARPTARLAVLSLGAMVFLSLLFVHLPIVLTSPHFESDWCKTLVISGGAVLLAKSLQSRENLTN